MRRRGIGLVSELDDISGPGRFRIRSLTPAPEPVSSTYVCAPLCLFPPIVQSSNSFRQAQTHAFAIRPTRSPSSSSWERRDRLNLGRCCIRC